MSPGGAFAGLIAVGLIWLISPIHSVSWADDHQAGTVSPRLLVSAKMVELVTGNPDGVGATAPIRYWVEGDKPLTVSMELVDIVVVEDGTRAILPLGSTTHTLEGIISWPEADTEYVPTGRRQAFSVTLTATPSTPETIRYGGLKISMTDGNAPGGDVGVRTLYSIVTTVLVLPAGWQGGLPSASLPQMTFSPVGISRVAEGSWIDRVLPDLPWVITRGPVAASMSIANSSKTPGYSSTTWDFSHRAETLLRENSENRLVLPGQEVTESQVSASAVPGSRRVANVLPSIGLVTVTAETKVTLAGQALDTSVRTARFLVLPWKEPFLLGLALLAIGILRRRRFAKSPTNPGSWHESHKEIVSARPR
jgi:hypothetical protein